MQGGLAYGGGRFPGRCPGLVCFTPSACTSAAHRCGENKTSIFAEACLPPHAGRVAQPPNASRVVAEKSRACGCGTNRRSFRQVTVRTPGPRKRSRKSTGLGNRRRKGEGTKMLSDCLGTCPRSGLLLLGEVLDVIVKPDGGGLQGGPIGGIEPTYGVLQVVAHVTDHVGVNR